MTSLEATPTEWTALAEEQDMKMAIAAYCFQCRDDSTAGPDLTKARVRDCTQTECPLWQHRDWQPS